MSDTYALAATDDTVELHIVRVRDRGAVVTVAKVHLTPDEALDLAKGLLIKAMKVASAAMREPPTLEAS